MTATGTSQHRAPANTAQKPVGQNRRVTGASDRVLEFAMKNDKNKLDESTTAAANDRASGRKKEGGWLKKVEGFFLCNWCCGW